MRLIASAGLMIGAALLAACAGGGGARARDLNAPETPQVLMSADALLFVSLDANHDLKVSMEEIESALDGLFDAADTNHDGLLQPVEFATWSAETMGGVQLPPYRLDFDRNVDNVITREEFRAELMARAREYDHDGDGAIERAEFLRPAPHAGAMRPEGFRPGYRRDRESPDGAPPG